MQELEHIVIFDFGSQYTQLIARRLREMGVYSTIVPPTMPLAKIQESNTKGIILSGGPGSTVGNTVTIDKALLTTTLPVLGICLGMQLLNSLNKGKVSQTERGEYGKQCISIKETKGLFLGLEEKEDVWMSHGDSISELAAQYMVTAKSDDGHIAAIEHQSLPHFGLQFHPEVSHSIHGHKILKNFISICKCQRNWTVENAIDQALTDIQTQVGSGRVISLISGGVDSTASTLLCFQALGKNRVIPIHIDSGLMRLGESQEVIELLRKQGIDNLHFINAETQFLHALKGISDPEQKRQIIGNLFIDVLENEMKTLGVADSKTYLCQGTLYTDLIESGKGCGAHAKVIKSHHNVNAPTVEAKRKAGLIVEPNKHIFKDEVRKICEALGVPRSLAWRHPFPGPGLAIRIIGEVTPERLNILRQTDAIYLEELHAAGLYHHIWQAFAVLIPVNTVGVMGDNRTVGHVAALRAVTSCDGMTADFFDLPHAVSSRISTRIVNEVEGINRVVYDITSKPPGTIEWE